jgi:hypothetical protein
MANEILGGLSYLMIAREDVWGSNPVGAAGSGSNASGSAQDYMFLPCREYSVRFRPENRQSANFLGLLQQKHSTNYRGRPSGNLVAPFIGWGPHNATTSLAQQLMEWGFASHEDTTPPSYTAAWAEGPNIANLLHNGLRVNSASLIGSADSGEVNISLGLDGKSEAALATMPGLPVDMEKALEANFAHVTLTLGGSEVQIKDFNWTVTSPLIVEYLNAFTPQAILKAKHLETFSCTLLKNSATYDVYRRLQADTELAATLTVQALHNGSAGLSNSYAKVSIALPRMHLLDVDDQFSMQDLTRQPLSFAVLKPDTSANASAMTWSTVA